MKPNNMNHKITQSIVLLHLFHYPQKNTLIPLTLTEYHHTFLRSMDNIFKPYKNSQITNYETKTIIQSWGKFEECEHAVNHQATVDTVFWHVSRKVISVNERWPIQKKPKDAQSWNRPIEVRPMDQENILRRCWLVRSGARPMESCRWSQERRRESGLYENLDDSVVIF